VLLEPSVIVDIGFQLSYLAIFGIVLLQPPLANLLQVKNRILHWMWTLFTVSVAAQLVTFPLSIFYFNQFPNLFWLSNFFVIPGTTLIIWLTIGFFLLSPIAMLSHTMADLIQYITHQLLVLLKWMSTLPHAVSEGIVYNQLQTWMLYGLIISVGIYIFSKRKVWLFGGLILLISFQGSFLWTKYSLFNQQILYVYQTKTSLIHCINGRDSYIIKHDDIPFKENEIHMIQNVCDHLKLKKPLFIDLRKSVELNTEDLKIRNHDIYFLNCHIKYTDVLNFHIQGLDLIPLDAGRCGFPLLIFPDNFRTHQLVTFRI
jgi:competence protein ComEC